MKVIAQEPWSWTLLEDDEAHYFTVLCGGVGIFEIEFMLNADELSRFDGNIHGAATELARYVRENQKEFGQRHLRDFSARPDVRQAGLRWRKKLRAEA